MRMFKWILAFLGAVNLGYGIFTFPSIGGGPLAQEIVTWRGLIAFFNTIVGAGIIAGLLGWYHKDIEKFISNCFNSENEDENE